MTEPDPGAAPADGGANQAPAPNLVKELAAESLELTAWILTPQVEYEPRDEPLPMLLRAAACRLQLQHPGHGPALCRHVYEVACAAAALVLAVRNAPEPDPHHTLDVAKLLTLLKTVPRTTLPDALRAAAHACRHATIDPPHNGLHDGDPETSETAYGHVAYVASQHEAGGRSR